MPAFVLPDLGEGLTEAEIVSWHVRVGDIVTVDQDVVEVETAKAVVEIPVPFAGRVAELHASPGDLLAVGAPLITVSDDRTGSGRRRRERRRPDRLRHHRAPAPAGGGQHETGRRPRARRNRSRLAAAGSRSSPRSSGGSRGTPASISPRSADQAVMA